MDAGFAPRPKLPLDSGKIEVRTAFDFGNQRRKLLLGEIDRIGFHIQVDVLGIQETAKQRVAQALDPLRGTGHVGLGGAARTRGR